MPKIAILTFNETTNYGAELQAFALQKSLVKLNCACEVLNYRCERIFRCERPMQISDQKSFKQFIRYIFIHASEQRRWNKFREFESKHVRMSSIKYDRSNINLANDEYDSFIVGSDQVWNLDVTGSDITFFLDFVKDSEKKNSYAASFGYSQIPDNFIEVISKNLNDFSILLVRERQGISIIEELIHKSAVLVLDPTLLVSKNEWVELIAANESIDPKHLKKGYIFLYQIDLGDKTLLNFIRKLAKKENLAILCCSQGLRNVYGVNYVPDASPRDFLEMVSDAKYVITGSFHALCFSLIFKKNFFYTCYTPNRSSRQNTIMDLTGLRGREILHGQCINTAPIDYSTVDTILETERQRSMSFLTQIIDRYK